MRVVAILRSAGDLLPRYRNQRKGIEMPKQSKSSAAEPPFPKGVAQPAIRALASAGFTHLDQLADASEKHIATLHGMGPKALEILRAALHAKGKNFCS
jgi:hypothetical protein